MIFLLLFLNIEIDLNSIVYINYYSRSTNVFRSVLWDMLSIQSKFVLREIGSNLDKNHHVFFLMYLIEIFKELKPEYYCAETIKL